VNVGSDAPAWAQRVIAWRMAVLWTFREPSLCRHVHRESATSGKAGGLKKVEPLKADRYCEPLKAVRL